MVKLGAADGASRAEIERRAGHVERGPRRNPALVGRQPERGRQLKFAVVDNGRARGQVRMRPGPVRKGPRSDVPRRDPDSEPRGWVEPVGNRQREAEWIAGPAVQEVHERDLVAGGRRWRAEGRRARIWPA